jgi:uncharacterized membrane protein YfcA
LKDLLLVIAAFVAGAQNAIAGGGSFVTFPALVFIGVPPIIANASSTVALFPGSLAGAWAYRHDFEPMQGVRLWAITLVSVVGGAVGAVLLLVTPPRAFDLIVPWLLLLATVLFAFGPELTRFVARLWRIGPATLLAIQMLIAIYGGYFGGAIGILMLALYGLFGLTNLNAMNGVKSLMAGLLNAVAVVVFVIAGKIWWHETGIMVLAAIAGGYGGARVARRVDHRYLRAVIILIAVAMTVTFFVRG